MTRRNTPHVSFIGFGEAGQAIASGLREGGIERIAAWDILFPVPEGARLLAAGGEIGVRCASSAADAVRDTDLVISAVTASSSLEAAQSVEPHLAGNPWYLDINSVSPGRKRTTAALLDEVTISLKNNYPGLDWPKMSEYNLERMASHGERRAAEMEESAATLRELGLDPLMVEATVKRQREMGAVGKDASVRASLAKGRAILLDAISAAKKTAQ